MAQQPNYETVAPRPGIPADHIVDFDYFRPEAHPDEDVYVALKRLHDARVNLVGAVLTKFDAKKVGYGTDYAYGYSYEYGSEKKPRGA